MILRRLRFSRLSIHVGGRQAAHHPQQPTLRPSAPPRPSAIGFFEDKSSPRPRVVPSPGMLSFELTDEQQMLQRTVADWAAREVAPRIRDLDRAHQFDRSLFPKMAALGLIGIPIPAADGGAGMEYICLGLASEALEYVDTSLRVIPVRAHRSARSDTADVGNRRSEGSATWSRRPRAA